MITLRFFLHSRYYLGPFFSLCFLVAHQRYALSPVNFVQIKQPHNMAGLKAPTFDLAA